MDEMKKIIECKYCNGYEYYGKFVWLNGKMLCRDCYKEEYRTLYNKPYEWSDLDGHRPTKEEYIEQCKKEGKYV